LEAGVDVEGHNRRWDEGALLAALRDRARLGKSLKPEHVKRDDSRLHASVIAYFGNFTRAVAHVAPVPWATTRWTPERVIEELRRVARRRKRVSAREAGGKLTQACRLYFGSYTAACREAGLEVDPLAVRRLAKAKRRASKDATSARPARRRGR
jgi:hypothetical protein